MDPVSLAGIFSSLPGAAKSLGLPEVGGAGAEAAAGAAGGLGGLLKGQGLLKGLGGVLAGGAMGGKKSGPSRRQLDEAILLNRRKANNQALNQLASLLLGSRTRGR